MKKEFLMQLSILGPKAWLLKDTAREVGEAEEAGNIKKIHSVPKSFSFSLLKMFHGFSFFNLSFQTDLRQMDSENKKTESLSCHFSFGWKEDDWC